MNPATNSSLRSGFAMSSARYARAISRIVVIGATGHIGSYLVPRLVRAGHEVVALSRGARDPYVSAPEWRSVERIAVDREAEDAAGVFGGRIAALAADAVVDLLCFTPESAQQLVEALRPTRPLLVHCGTIWVHGPAARVPVTEDEPRTAYGEYGTGKAAIEALLHRETVAGGVPSVVLHPGHISGPWPVITPAGNLDLDVWRRLAIGEPLPLPDLGLGVLHHVHADDVAQAFERALDQTGSDRIELPRGVRAGHDAARTGRGCGRMVRPRAGPRVRRLVRVRATRRRRARRDESRSTWAAASPRASIGPATCSATSRDTAHSTLSTTHFTGLRRTATSISATRTSDHRSLAPTSTALADVPPDLLGPRDAGVRPGDLGEPPQDVVAGR